MKHLRNNTRRALGAQRRQSLLPVVRKVFVEQPVEKLCMQEVANRSGVSLWALRYSFESGDVLFRDVMRDLIQAVSATCRYTRATGDSVVETIRDFAEFSADVVSTPDYRDLLYLILRYGKYHSWLHVTYNQDIVKKLHDELELAVLRTGQRSGSTVLFREGAVRRFHRTIETEFGLAPLLHVDGGRSPDSSERILRDVASEAFAATYLFEWEPASAA